MAVNWIQAREILDEALQIPVEGRSPYLDNACPDPELRRYVESLIISYDKATEFLEQPAVTLLAEPWQEAESPKPWVGRRIGSYLIEREIGEGGMGTVFLAMRADDEYQKRVAIKLVKGGFASSFAIARFKTERQILAGLEHPNIARLLDGGRTEEGYPYLVMEFVDGIPIDEYCDAHRLTISQRLQLFRTVCDAVRFAHQNLIIHRDLKPGNILVTTDGVPKLLDFGIAKLLSPDALSPTPEQTLGFVRMFTPDYASPEQICGDVVSTTTDVYSLGVVLYFLLTGHQPYRLTGSSAQAAIEIICHTQPVKPSAIVLRTQIVSAIGEGQTLSVIPEFVSSARDTQPDKLRRCLSGDLDNIALMALQKEPKRRYGSVEELALDIDRHLQHQPVKARPSTLAYRVSKFIQRHKTEVSAALIVVLVSVAAVLGTIAAGWVGRQSSVPARSDWVQLTSFVDSATSPTLSPDGRMMAFIRGPETFVTPGQIYIKMLPDGQPVQLTHDDSPKMAPAFSPDGSRIAYTATDSSAGWNTWVVPALGGEPQELLPNAAALTWVDREHVVFSEIKTGIHMGIATATESRAGERDVYLPAEMGGMAHRSWISPDGKWTLVSEMDRVGWRPCRVLPFDGSSGGETAGPKTARCTYAAWSPDGKMMYFSADAGDGYHIWRQHFPGGVPEQLTFGPTEEEGIAVSPDGRSLVTSAGIRQSSVWVHDAWGDRQISGEGFASLPGLGFGGVGASSIFSPDGKRLYYLVRKQSSRALKGQLWMTDLNSGRSEAVLPGVSVSEFTIAPDGERVVYAALDAEETSHVWMAPLDRRAPPKQLTSSVARMPIFGSGGDVYFMAREGDLESLYSVGPDETVPQKMNLETGEHPTGISPHGDWWLSGFAPVIAHPTLGGSPIRVCDFCGVAWGPDGKFLYLRFRDIGEMGGGKTIVIALPPGKELPNLPAGGLKSAEDVKGLNIVAKIDLKGITLFAPGPNASIYAYERRTVQRNLFRIPLK